MILPDILGFPVFFQRFLQVLLREHLQRFFPAVHLRIPTMIVYKKNLASIPPVIPAGTPLRTEIPNVILPEIPPDSSKSFIGN